MDSRQPYQGLSRKLVLAFDVGTTYSGISYSILDPGNVPQIKPVTKYPAQENVGGDCKIPSIIFYDRDGAVRAIGAEALQEDIIEEAADEGWTKLEWWKLHLRPKNLASFHINNQDIPPLPPNKTAVEVLGDFLRYLYKCARTYIQDTHAGGLQFWESIEGHIDFVLSHPNGWEGPQQSQIRRAAVLGGLVKDAEQSRIQLVTEGEASLHFCLNNGLASDGIKDGQGVVIVDAGGGTIDLSAYSVTGSTGSTVSFEEIAPTECRLQGSVFVTRRANAFLEEKLRGSRYGTPEAISQISACFDKTTKLRFRNANEPSYIRFGSVQEKELSFNIRSGQLRLAGTEVAPLFEPSILAIIDAIEQQCRVAHKEISSIFLVGGFAASSWLFSKLQEYLQPRGITFCRPDSHVNKAVADGAVSFYLDNRVAARVAKYTYGIECSVSFDVAQAEHKARSKTVFSQPSGDVCIRGCYSTILKKGTCVKGDQEFRSPYYNEYQSCDGVGSLVINILSYKGKHDPTWLMDKDSAMFSTHCTVTGETPAAMDATPRFGLDGKQYYHQDFDIILLFGLTELKAQISWKKNGVEQRGPATIVYDE